MEVYRDQQYRRRFTIGSLKQAYFFLIRRAHTEPDLWPLVKIEGRSQEELNSWVALLAQNEDRFASNLVTREYRPRMLDGWGQPVNMSLADQIDRGTINPDMVSASTRIVMWSNGPNKLNEGGRGDDIWIHPSVVTELSRSLDGEDHSGLLELKQSGGWHKAELEDSH